MWELGDHVIGWTITSLKNWEVVTEYLTLVIDVDREINCSL